MHLSWARAQTCYSQAAEERSAGRVPAESKECRRCHETKGKADFYHSKMTADGLQSYCKVRAHPHDPRVCHAPGDSAPGSHRIASAMAVCDVSLLVLLARLLLTYTPFCPTSAAPSSSHLPIVRVRAVRAAW